MFNKKKCAKCGKSFRKDFNFCPSCGNSSRFQDPREYGLLGKDDKINEVEEFANFFNSFGGAVLGKMLAGTMKMLEKELVKEMNNAQNHPKNLPPRQMIPSNMQLFINGKKVNLSQQGIPEQPSQKPKKTKQNIQVKKYLNEDSRKKSIKLPQEEPTVEIKRLSNSILYELNIPGVQSLDDISIVQLENSIEIKAIAKDKIYSKTMKISLPILSYELDKDKLILELDAE